MPTTESRNSGMLGNSRSRLGFMRLAARTQPQDFLDFFWLKNSDNAFAITVQRVGDILTGQVPHRISPKYGLTLARRTTNTVPVLASPERTTVFWLGVQSFVLTTIMLGRTFWVQPTDPTLDLANVVSAGDVWIK